MLRGTSSSIQPSGATAATFNGFVDSQGNRLPVPYTLSRSSVPVGISPSGIIGNNGAYTSGTAFQVTYSTGIYLYYPANAIVTGQTAGLYWTVMTSTTVGTIYNNLYTTGESLIPTTLVPFVSTGPGAFVQTTGLDIVLRNVQVNANSLGQTARVFMRRFDTVPNTVGNKVIKQMYGGQNFGAISGITVSSNLGQVVEREFGNRGVSAQISPSTSNSTALGGATIALLTVDSTSNQPVTITAQIAVATDYVVLEMALIEVYP